MFFAPRKAEKFSKFAKNELKVVKVGGGGTKHEKFIWSKIA